VGSIRKNNMKKAAKSIHKRLDYHYKEIAKNVRGFNYPVNFSYVAVNKKGRVCFRFKGFINENFKGPH